MTGAAVRHSRRTREALLGRRMGEVFPGIENTPMFGSLRRCMEERVTLRMENEFQYPEGGQGQVELRFEPVPEGGFILWPGVARGKPRGAEWRRPATATE